MPDTLLLYQFAVNFASFLTFAWDKLCAIRGWWRVSEATLLLLAIGGGTLGALAAQQGLRHKTRKEPFRSMLWTIAGAQLLLLVAMVVPSSRDFILDWLNGVSERRL